MIKIDEVQTVLQSTGPSKEDENMDMNKNESKADKKGKDKREKHSEKLFIGPVHCKSVV